MTAAVLLGLSACAPHEPRAKAVLTLVGDPARGSALYEETCARCHRKNAGWRFTLQWYGRDGFVSTLIDGVPKSRMPSFSAWSDQQLADVHAYIQAANP
ncbi:MAG: c-type cytochrome [Caulobacterales bacterium]